MNVASGAQRAILRTSRSGNGKANLSIFVRIANNPRCQLLADFVAEVG
jgi:hypothetical protein